MSAMEQLKALIRDLTGRKHVPKDPPPAPYRQTRDVIETPDGDVEALLHELCHWLVASPEERDLVNLGMREDDPTPHSRLREEQAWRLECKLLEPFATEAEIHARLTPESRSSHPVFQGGWQHDGRLALQHGLRSLSVIDAPTWTRLRQILGLWDREQRETRH
jgi:hypothetical protein